MTHPVPVPDASDQVDRWLAAFNAALHRRDVDDLVALFHDDCYWRDLLAMAWDIQTAEGPQSIRLLAAEALEAEWVLSFRRSVDWPAADCIGGVASCWLDFETQAGHGRAHVRIQGGKALTMLTALQELTAHEEMSGPRRHLGADHVARRNKQTWLQRRVAEREAMGAEVQPYALIVGAGQGGLAVAARLKHLGVPALVIEQLDKPGDSWRRRYPTLCLHDVVWYDHLPYLDFPKTWPVYTPKDKMADWLSSYAELMDIDVWTSTVCAGAEWDQERQGWTVTVNRNGVERVLRPVHIILATGVTGEPMTPSIPGQDVFVGDQHHSSRHPGPAQYRDKRVVVIGSNNSAHDICAALWEAGAMVTMIQRSSTLVVKVDTMRELSQAPLYSEEALGKGITTDKADLTVAAIPAKLMPGFQRPRWDEIRARDDDFYRALDKAGFKVDFGDDDSGLWMKYLSRGGGYYIDVGASQLIIDGAIELRSGHAVRELTSDGVVLDSGEQIPAEVIVYATGFGNMNDSVRSIFGNEIADLVGPIWGIGSGRYGDPGPWEGELRNMWKPTAALGLWIHGGNLALSRHYSRYLALQIKARHAGIVTDDHWPGLDGMDHR